MKFLFGTFFRNVSWSSLSVLAISLPANAFQLDITSVDTTLINGGSSVTANGIAYEGDQLRIDSFTANGLIWESVTSSNAILRRNDRGGTVSNRNIVWIERSPSFTTSNPTLLGPVPTDVETALNGNNLYSGSDNLFVNSGESNVSSIERVDYILDSSTTSNSNVGFTVFERGGTTVHDSFQIALILGVDSSDNPTSYSDFININAGWGQSNLEISAPLNPGATRSILRDDNGDMVFAENTSTNQDIGGVLVTLDEFTEGGSAITAPILGYSLFGGDVDGTSATVTDFNTYPLSASTQQSGLGLDPIALNLGLVQEVVPFEFSSGFGLLLSGVGFLGFKLANRQK